MKLPTQLFRQEKLLRTNVGETTVFVKTVYNHSQVPEMSSVRVSYAQTAPSRWGRAAFASELRKGESTGQRARKCPRNAIRTANKNQGVS